MRLDTKLKWWIFPDILPSILCCLCQPAMHKVLIEMIPSSRFLAAENAIWCISGMISCFFWGKLKDGVMKYYPIIEVIESATIIILYTFFFINWNPVLYYIMDVCFGVVVTTLFGQCFNTMKVMVFNGDDGRERINADNCIDFFKFMGSMIGSVLGVIFIVPIKFALLLFILSDVIRTTRAVVCYGKYYKPKLSGGKL